MLRSITKFVSDENTKFQYDLFFVSKKGIFFSKRLAFKVEFILT